MFLKSDHFAMELYLPHEELKNYSNSSLTIKPLVITIISRYVYILVLYKYDKILSYDLEEFHSGQKYMKWRIFKFFVGGGGIKIFLKNK
jgi:hypothetical protein